MGRFSFSDTKSTSVPLTKEQIRKIFIEADTNHDNCLSVEELKNAFDNLGTYLPGTRAQIGIWQADANDDGQISMSNSSELDQLVNYASGLGLTITNKTRR
ncbi:hypothetical protein M5689_021304 [Euphorbia peplus]|nr:hypothetical protein M5689_021304 [Euphorbia peplus]